RRLTSAAAPAPAQTQRAARMVPVCPRYARTIPTTRVISNPSRSVISSAPRSPVDTSTPCVRWSRYGLAQARQQGLSVPLPDRSSVLGDFRPVKSEIEKAAYHRPPVRLTSFVVDGHARVGVVDGTTITPLDELVPAAPPDMLATIEQWDRVQPLLARPPIRSNA